MCCVQFIEYSNMKQYQHGFYVIIIKTRPLRRKRHFQHSRPLNGTPRHYAVRPFENWIESIDESSATHKARIHFDYATVWHRRQRPCSNSKTIFLFVVEYFRPKYTEFMLHSSLSLAPHYARQAKLLSALHNGIEVNEWRRRRRKKCRIHEHKYSGRPEQSKHS